MIILNHAAIHDRTNYILDRSEPNPLPQMTGDAKTLEKAGADYIVIPCNTAHFFYDEIQNAVDTKIINIIEETVLHIRNTLPDAKKVGILATKGTLVSGAYQNMLGKHGLDFAVPDEADTEKLMEIIYEQVKAGKSVDIEAFWRIINNLKKAGCDCVVLGCTELSVIYRDYSIADETIVDSLLTLAKKSIELCGKKIKSKN
jgi:aspartate racemase